MRNPTRIPFIDLGADLRSIKNDCLEAIGRVIDSGKLILGDELAAFEEEFAAWNQMPHAVGVSSGLAALTLMLQALDIGTGDEVLVAGNTHIATWLAVSKAGATPVPVEPDLKTRNMDPACLQKQLSRKTRAVLATHLYGAPCDMNQLRDFCDRHNLILAIDAAQACGSSWEGNRAACLGDAAAFSFYPTKNLGSLGEAGAVVCRDRAVAEKVRLLRNYGMRDRYHHLLHGENARLEEIHAAVLRIQLRRVDELNEQRKMLAARYLDHFGDLPEGFCQQVPAEADSAWHLFTIRLPHRDVLAESLRQQGIETAVHYPVPPHLSGAYSRDAVSSETLPATEQLAREILSLPLYPGMRNEEVDHVAQAVLDMVKRT